MPTMNIITADVLDGLQALPAESVNCVVTSPPYWGLRDYGNDGQLGLEATPEEYTAKMVGVFREVRRVLRKDGTLWLNLGDCYATGGGKVGDCPGGGKQGKEWKGTTTQPNRMPLPGLKPKDLVGIPWRIAFALQSDGWYLRQDIIWHKPNPMPESVRDRCTKSHEYIFLMSKDRRYHYDHEAIKEKGSGLSGGASRSKIEAYEAGDKKHRYAVGLTGHKGYEERNRRSVWTIPTSPYPGAHFAVFPEALVAPCIKAGCPEDGTVLDPFNGAGTTGLVAVKLGRNYIGIELNPEYAEMARARIMEEVGLFVEIKDRASIRREA